MLKFTTTFDFSFSSDFDEKRGVSVSEETMTARKIASKAFIREVSLTGPSPPLLPVALS